MAHIQEALAVAINHVNLHNILGEPLDRLTFLDARLVCRSWRNFDVFSRNITSVTLHRLADLQLAARFFPRAPSLRPPWRRLEDVSIFPNLRTLKISNHLNHELVDSAEAELFCQECKDFDIEVLKLQPPLFTKLAPLFTRLRYVVSLTIDLGSSAHYTDNGQLTFMDEVIALPCLRRLALDSSKTGVSQLNVPSLRALSQITSLRHLGFQGLICSQEQLAQCLSLGSSLSHLTRLDLVLKATEDATLSKFREDFAQIAPRVLHTSRFTFRSKNRKTGTSYEVVMEGSGPGRLQLVESSLVMIGGKVFFGKEAASVQLLRALEHGCPTSRLLVELSMDIAAPDERIAINLSSITAVETISVVLHYQCSYADAGRLVAQRCVPVFEALPGVQQMATKELRIRVYNQMDFDIATPIFKSGVVKELPAVFLNLQSLHVQSTEACRFRSLSSLRELTRLTQLGLSGIYSFDDDADWDVHFSSFLPTSLKTLDLSKCQNSSVPSLDHCTALTNLRIETKREDYNLESLYSCHAALKSLSFICPSYDVMNLHMLASTFPLLEELHLSVTLVDVSPFSSLQYLRQLNLGHDLVHIGDTDLGYTRLLGLNTLTAVRGLTVLGAIPWQETFIDLMALTQLRRLWFWICDEYVRDKNRQTSWKEKGKQLRAALPHTNIYTNLGG